MDVGDHAGWVALKGADHDVERIKIRTSPLVEA